MRIAVVGAGVIGLCCAVRLAGAGCKVTVFDPAVDRRAPSWNNAGHLAVEQVAPLASLAALRSLPRRRFAAGGAVDLPWSQWRAWLPFGLRLIAASRPSRFRHGADALRTLLGQAMPAWHRVACDLDRPDLIQEDGHLIAWETAATAAAGRRAWTVADTGGVILADVTDDDLRQLNRLVGGSAAIAGAVRFAGSGQVNDLTTLADALERALAARGGDIVRATVRLLPDRGEVRVDGHDADVVVVAAGVASGTLLRTIDHHVPVIAERGYHLRAAADPSWPAAMPPIVFEDRSMIVTRYADTVQAAGFVEFTADEVAPDARKWDRLERHICELGLPMRPPFTRWAGARPTLPDYLPAIGRSANMIYAFGHQHLGLTLAPITAELVGALVDGTPPAIDLAPFDLARFERAFV